jgi:hypothetical protein
VGGQPYVGEHDGGEHRFAGEGQPERVPHDAVHTVGTDHVIRAEHGVVEGHLRPVRVLRQVGDVCASHDAGAGRGGTLFQQPFHVVLRGDQQEREPGRELRQVDVDAVEKAELPDLRAGGDEFVGQAAGVEVLTQNASPPVRDCAGSSFAANSVLLARRPVVTGASRWVGCPRTTPRRGVPGVVPAPGVI